MAMLDPLFMDIDEVYSGDEFGLPYRDLIGEGVVDPSGGQFEVTAGSGNSVDVAAGAAWVTGDTNTSRQPTYRCINDASVNLGISPDPSNPRKVRIVIQITDEAFDGTGREAELLAIHGTPAASPADPALPDSALPLAVLTVPAAAADSSAYTITDGRGQARIGEGGLPVASAAGGDFEPIKKTTEEDVVSTTTETDLLNGEAVISAGAMGTDGMLKFLLIGDILSNDANANPTLRIKLGGTTLYEDAVSFGAADADRRPFIIDGYIGNLGADNLQFWAARVSVADTAGTATTGIGDLGQLVDASAGARIQGTGAIGEDGTAAVDTSASVTLEITVQWGTAAATSSWRLKYACIEVV